MAFNPIQIPPIDFNKSAAVGIDLPFSGPGGVTTNITSGSATLPFNNSQQNTPFRSNFTTADALKNNLINYFLTNLGERPLNPLFGGGLRSYIFEQISSGNLSFLKTKIQKDLNLYFPNVIVDDLNVSGQEDNNTVNVVLTYKVANTNINDTLNLNFS